MIPLSVPNFEGNEEKNVMDAVHQGWVSTGGAYVNKFEDGIGEYVHAKAAVVCQSGTAALHLSLVECGVEYGDMVIVPTLTFIAAVNPVMYVGAEPVFMDCDDSLCMDPEKLRRFLETQCERTPDGVIYTKKHKKIKAVIVVHVFGNLADMEKIMELAGEYGLKVIEDATEALGSYYTEGNLAGRFAGTIGDIGAFSFNGNKIITTGGGGAVVAKDEQNLKHIKYLSTQSKDDEHFYIHNEVGYNYRMTNVQAAIGVAQLEELEEFISRKNKNHALYAELLSDCETGYLLPFRNGTRSNKWFYSFVLNKEICKKEVRTYIEFLEKNGIQSRPIWGLIHMQKPYRDMEAFEIEKAIYYAERVINIPCSTNIREEDIRYVSECLKKI